MELHDAVTMPAIQKVSAITTVAGSGAAIIFGLSANDIAALIGATVAVCALVLNVAITIYFKRAHLELVRSRLQQRREGDKEFCPTCPLSEEGKNE